MGWLCAGFALVVIVGGIIVSAMKAAALGKARLAYELALNSLSDDPENNGLRIGALNAGRYYVQLAREQAKSKGVVVFDEVALQNDLNARLGKGSRTAQTAQQPVSVSGDRVEQLTRLGELRDRGVLTPQEFEAEKRRILVG